MTSRMVSVNDRMQRGYRYALVAPAGRAFHQDFRPDLTPADMLALGVFVAMPATGWIVLGGARPNAVSAIPVAVSAGLAVWSVPLYGSLVLQSYRPALLGVAGWLIAIGWLIRNRRRVRVRHRRGTACEPRPHR